MNGLTQTQSIALVAAFACLLALVAGIIHDRLMAERSQEGKPWVKPAHPLALLTLATVLSILTAVLALQGR